MSISSVLLAGLSGLRASQTAMGVVSQNLANANTPGYVRAEVSYSPLVQVGQSGGVQIESITRAADQFLATASYIAAANYASASVRSDLLTRAQESFGDPASSASMFAQLDSFWSSLSEISVDPSSALRRGDAVSALQAMFSEVNRVGSTLQDLIAEADQRIANAVDEAQDLMNRIDQLNGEIRLNQRIGADSTAAENSQSILVDRLSQLMDVRVTKQDIGGINVRTSGGALLVGISAARLSYTPNDSNFATHGVIRINEQLGTQSNLEPLLLGGEIKGLIRARDVDLPGLANALGGFAAALGDALNAAHNENASSPAAGSLTGRQTGLLGSDVLGFSGEAIIGITDATGNLTQRLTIDFDAGEIYGEDPLATYSFIGGDIDALATALNTAFAAANPPGSASFSGGVLQLDVGAGGGIVIQQDPDDPADRAGRGFSHFFGLNDLVSRSTPMFFETGLQGSDEHDLNTGGGLTYEVRDNLGRLVGTRSFSITGPIAAPGATWNDFLSELNAPGAGGLGDYGTFALDANTGQVRFTPNAGYEATLIQDSTQRGTTGISFTALNGLSNASTQGRGLDVQVAQNIGANPILLAVGRPDLTVDIGDRIVEDGDSRGAAALLGARDTTRSFGANGVLTAQTTTLGIYAARLGGEAGRMAADAERAATGSLAVANAANDRRGAVEGVSLDDELMKMTVYQNSYAASARVIQAATEMLDILLSIGYR